jgi:hypothetical protein
VLLLLLIRETMAHTSDILKFFTPLTIVPHVYGVIMIGVT